MSKIYLHNGITIETIDSNNKNVRSKRVLLTKLINSDETVDYCFDREMLNDMLDHLK